jgi:hypothetical protein
MRKWAVATLLVASCTLANAQEGPTPKDAAADNGGNWFTRLFSVGGKPDTDKAPAAETKKSPPPVVESLATKRDREEKALNRRNAVCLRLREIAVQTNDMALYNQVDDLEQQAWKIYQQRTGVVPANDSRFDEQILEKHLSSGAAAAQPASGAVRNISSSTTGGREGQ